MKKIFRVIGLLSLISFSFFVSQKTALMVKEQDDIMIKIKEVENAYFIEPIQAIINEDEMIPGINGSNIDIEKSYSEMRKIGTYSTNLLQNEVTYVDELITDNYDKYIISGNKSRNYVSLVFVVDQNDNIDTLKNILNQNEISVTFFVDTSYLLVNEDNIDINHHYSVIYKNDPLFIWSNNLIENTFSQENFYCLNNQKDNELLNDCIYLKYSTIKASIIYNSINDVKENITNGSIISIDYTTNIDNEITTIINYIKSKGYEIKNLEELLVE